MTIGKNDAVRQKKYHETHKRDLHIIRYHQLKHYISIWLKIQKRNRMIFTTYAYQKQKNTCIFDLPNSGIASEDTTSLKAVQAWKQKKNTFTTSFEYAESWTINTFTPSIEKNKISYTKILTAFLNLVNKTSLSMEEEPTPETTSLIDWQT